jgi:hypothetical protein
MSRWSRDSSVDKVTRLWAGGLENLGLIPESFEKFFFSSKCPFHFLGPLSLLFKGYKGAFSPRVKPQEVDYLHPPARIKVKKIGANIYSIKGHQLLLEQFY